MSDFDIRYLKNCSYYGDTLARWRYEEWGDYKPGLTLKYAKQSMKEHCNIDKLPITLVGIQNNEPVGMICLRKCDIETYSILTPWIGSVYVKKEYRGAKLSSRLMKAGEEKLLSLGYQKVYIYIYHESLKELYQPLGYEIISRGHYNAHPIIVMQKNLNLS